MTALERDEAWARLRRAGLAQGQPPSPDPANSQWYVRVMLGVAGWIAALFLLAFVGAALSFLFREAIIGIAVGLACCVAAYALLRARPTNDFLVQFALAASLSGQVLFVIGVMEGAWDHAGSRTGRLLIVALFEAGLAIAMPLFIHRVWSSWAAVFPVAVAAGQMSMGAIVPALVSVAAATLWLTEFAAGRQTSLSRAAAYGLSLALLQLQGLAAWGVGSDLASLSTRHAMTWETFVSAALPGTVLVIVAWRLLSREGATLSGRPAQAALGIAVLLAILGIRMPGLAAAAMLAVLGFANGNRVLLGLGLFGLLAFVSSYYYRLDVTLLTKSGYLAVAGVALLLVRQALVGLVALREPGRA